MNICSRMSRNSIPAILFLAVCAISPAQAAIYGGVDFPQGEISFADSVFDFSPIIKSGQPGNNYLNADAALGIPDYTSGVSCTTPEACKYVSLGDGGSITVQFTNNLLTGSDDNTADLWIFEVGPDVEDTFVEISTNGIDWISVGAVGGSTSGVDLDAFGYGTGDAFAYVRLTDDPDRDDQSGSTVGADIDAIGAISTIPAVPVPAAVWLFASALGLLGTVRRFRS